MSHNPPSLKEIQSLQSAYDAQQTVAALKRVPKTSWFGDVKLLFKMMEDPRFSLQGSSLATIGGALAYVVLPTDLVPDFIPMLGWIDDALVVKLVMDSAKSEISRYRNFITRNA